jgi:hypothetical protein
VITEVATVEIERSECTFCELPSEYVLSVEDPCPFEDEQVLDESVAMPICIEHYRDLSSSGGDDDDE